MRATIDDANRPSAAILAGALSLYAGLAAAATVVYPPFALAFAAPLLLALGFAARPAKAAPRRIVFTLILAAAFLLPVWPAYIFIKVGPAPILTPPRLLLYAVSLLWLYDMAYSPWRRAQFVLAMKKSAPLSAAVLGFFALGLVGLPFAEGKALAFGEFFRQVVIWLIPYLAVLTYSRRQRDFAAIVRAFVIGAFFVAVAALAEAASHRLLADLLSPFIADDAEWLRKAQAMKIRDGHFRTQSTHTHPLSLGEFLAVCAPLALGLFVASGQKSARLLWGAASLAIALAAITTNSRGVMLVLAIAFVAMIGLLAWRYLKRTAASRWRPLAGLLALSAIALSPAGVVGAHYIISGKTGASAANSTQSRVDQMALAWPKIQQRPIGGYGAGRATRVLGYWGKTLTIDNYYLSLALDLGLPGPLCFIALFFIWARSALARAGRCHPSLGAVYVAAFAAAVSFAASRAITSQTANLSVLFVLLAAFAGAGVTFSRRKSRNRA
jgi:O-antigen ligase